MTQFLTQVLLAYAMAFTAPDLAFANERGQVSVVAEIEQAENVFYLRFTLRNSGSTDLRLYNNSLPWVDRPGAVHLKAIALDQRFPTLEEKGRLHNTVGTVTLRPSEEIRGSINLNNRFEKFSDTLTHSPIAVLWAYAPKSPDDTTMRETSGVATVSRKKQ